MTTTDQPPLYYTAAAVWQSLIGQGAFKVDVPTGSTAAYKASHRTLEVPDRYTPAQAHAARMDHLLRLFSVLCGASTVVAAQAAGRMLYRGRRPLLGSTALGLLVATWPKFLVVASSVTNDVLADALCAWAFVGALWLLLAGGEPPRRVNRVALSTGCAGAGAVLSKSTSVPVVAVLVAVVAVAFLLRRRRPLPVVLMTGAVVLGTVWWFVREQRDYGDPLAAAADERFFQDTIPGLVQPVPLTHVAELLRLRTPYLTRSLLYDGGWNQLGAPAKADDVFWALVGISTACCLLWTLRLPRAERRPWLLVGATVLAGFGAWVLIAAQTTQGEGRYLLVSIPAMGAAMTGGIGLVRNRGAAIAAGLLWPAFFLCVDAYVLARYVIPDRG